MTPDELVRVLLMVPEKRLAISSLLWGPIGDDDQLDPAMAVFAAEELHMAVQEAQSSQEGNRWLAEELTRRH